MYCAGGNWDAYKERNDNPSIQSIEPLSYKWYAANKDANPQSDVNALTCCGMSCRKSAYEKCKSNYNEGEKCLVPSPINSVPKNHRMMMAKEKILKLPDDVKIELLGAHQASLSMLKGVGGLRKVF